ncbi:MAG: sulfur reduction protein DsrE [Desulfobacterium sp.]|nr:sulfur reduction protein DsrE [Desulfobacterium sp.]MBU3947685.1 sulfur reduction protein DsrE [Pseudomonadota bacterium]MBU4035175.1 sulfur reduction protein DsrE [Pseudomonadota bacterium]
MKVAYIFSTSNTHYILSNMIIPQLESGTHGFEVCGMFFFLDNTFMLVEGNDVGERLSRIAAEKGMLLMGCDKCVIDRRIQDCLVEAATIGCFPDLYKALAGAGIDQVITL